MKRTSRLFLALVPVASVLALACGSSGSTDGTPGGDTGSAGSASSAPVSTGGGSAPQGGGPSSSGASSGGVDAGGASSSGSSVDPFSASPTCTSGKTWAFGPLASVEMEPGMACNSCHFIGGVATKFPFDISGTVYPTAHEPDLCYGAPTATVVITDAKGTDHTLTVNAAGNFYNLNYLGVGAIPTPYKAKVIAGGKTRVMVSAQTNGDCNTCHSQSGAQSAQGRILLP